MVPAGRPSGPRCSSLIDADPDVVAGFIEDPSSPRPPFLGRGLLGSSNFHVVEDDAAIS